jgi:hypothetical protein
MFNLFSSNSANSTNVPTASSAVPPSRPKFDIESISKSINCEKIHEIHQLNETNILGQDLENSFTPLGPDEWSNSVMSGPPTSSYRMRPHAPKVRRVEESSQPSLTSGYTFASQPSLTSGYTFGSMGCDYHNIWNQTILQVNNPEELTSLNDLNIPKQFLNSLQSFKVPTNAKKPMQLKLEQIDYFKWSILSEIPDTTPSESDAEPTEPAETIVNLWDHTEKYPFIVHIIEQLNYQKRTINVAKNNCYIDEKGILQDCKSKNVKSDLRDMSQLYNQMMEERTAFLPVDPTKPNPKRRCKDIVKNVKNVTKTQLVNLVEELYKDTRCLTEHEKIQHFIKSLKEDFDVTSKAYVNYCQEYKKYETLKKNIFELSKIHDTIKENIEDLGTHKEETREEYTVLNESLQKSIIGMTESIDTVAMADLQDKIETVAGRYHYIKEIHSKILGTKNVCSLCNTNNLDTVLECGHQYCQECVMRSDLYCNVCDGHSKTSIKLK